LNGVVTLMPLLASDAPGAILVQIVGGAVVVATGVLVPTILGLMNRRKKRVAVDDGVDAVEAAEAAHDADIDAELAQHATTLRSHGRRIKAIENEDEDEHTQQSNPAPDTNRRRESEGDPPEKKK
jgi:hypothetical protein